MVAVVKRIRAAQSYFDARSWQCSLAALLICGVGSISACSSADSRAPLFDSSELPLTLMEFRILVGDFSEYFVAVIADAGESVIDTSADQFVRRNAMEFRLRALNGFLNALSTPDPVASLIDAWAFCLQLADFVEPGGAGAELFGDQQPLMIEAMRDIADEADRLVRMVSNGPIDDASNEVMQWVDEHPLTSLSLIRKSTTLMLADRLESQDNSAFAAVRRLQSGVGDTMAQTQRYISVMPRTIRWHSQLILHETLYDELKIGDTLASFELLSKDFVEFTALADEMFAGLPNREELEARLSEALANLESLIEAERARLLVEIDRQRGLVFEDVDLQREAIMRDVDAQIALAEEMIDAHIDEAFARIEALTDETLRESFDRSERLVQMIFVYAFILLLVALAGGAGLILLSKSRQSKRTAGASNSGR